MHLVKVKPLSLNSAYRGRRFKTPELEQYKNDVIFQLPNDITIPKGKLELEIHFGVSTKNCDVDNFCKCFIDCLSVAYEFNDNLVYRINVRKVDTKKGNEYIAFEIRPFTGFS